MSFKSFKCYLTNRRMLTLLCFINSVNLIIGNPIPQVTYLFIYLFIKYDKLLIFDVKCYTVATDT